jgi:hypothetical protein
LSIRTADFDDDTWTAGTSGKKFGSVYSRPNASAMPIRTNFQAG